MTDDDMIKKLRDLTDAATPEIGHAPKPEHHARVAELRKQLIPC